jgi:hypothetical protein
VSDDIRRARDLKLLDDIDAFKREPFSQPIWRVVREGRDPILGSASKGRWSNGTFDVLYTSVEQDGAIAEIYSLLSLQPVFPSKTRWFAHKLKVSAKQTLKLADIATLNRLGVDTVHYTDRQYDRTQEIADVAYFLGFDGLIAPSARWECLNAVLFTDRIPPDQIEITKNETKPIAWDAWRKRTRI